MNSTEVSRLPSAIKTPSAAIGEAVCLLQTSTRFSLSQTASFAPLRQDSSPDTSWPADDFPISWGQQDDNLAVVECVNTEESHPKQLFFEDVDITAPADDEIFTDIVLNPPPQYSHDEAVLSPHYPTWRGSDAMMGSFSESAPSYEDTGGLFVRTASMPLPAALPARVEGSLVASITPPPQQRHCQMLRRPATVDLMQLDARSQQQGFAPVPASKERERGVSSRSDGGDDSVPPLPCDAAAVTTAEQFARHALRQLRVSYFGCNTVPSHTVIQERALPGAPEATAAELVKAPRLWSVFTGPLQSAEDMCAIFCHSSCGAQMSSTMDRAHIEYMGVVNLLHKKWEVVLMATLRNKFARAVAVVRATAAAATTAAVAPDDRPRKRPRRAAGGDVKARTTLSSPSRSTGGSRKRKSAATRKCTEMPSLTHDEFDAAAAVHGFNFCPADFETMSAEFMKAAVCEENAALAARFLAEMRFSMFDPADEAAALVAAAKAAGKCAPLPSELPQRLAPLTPAERAQLMAATTLKTLQENSMILRFAAFVAEGSASGSITWDEARACFFASRKDMETNVLGKKGDIWRSMSFYCPFFTRMLCAEHESGCVTD